MGAKRTVKRVRRTTSSPAKVTKITKVRRPVIARKTRVGTGNPVTRHYRTGSLGCRGRTSRRDNGGGDRGADHASSEGAGHSSKTKEKNRTCELNLHSPDSRISNVFLARAEAVPSLIFKSSISSYRSMCVC